MTSSKSDKIILWGGKENTLIPQANTKKIKEENALYEKRISLEAELEATEQKINQIKEKGLKYEIDVTKELKEHAKIRGRIKKLISDTNKKNDDLQQKYAESANLSSLQARLQKQISSEIGKVGSGIQKASMGYYKTNQMAHGFLETILDIPAKQREIEASIKPTNDLLQNGNDVLKQQGKDYESLIMGSGETLDLTMKLAENYDAIGTSDFVNMTADAEKNLKQRQREADYIKNTLGPALQLAYDSGEMDASEFALASKELKVMSRFANKNVKEGQALVDRTREQNHHSKLTAATIDYMSKPLNMLKTGMEALPFGGVASEFLNLGGIIEDFQGNITQTIANSLEQTTENGKKVNNMNFGLAVTNVSKAMKDSIDRIKKGVEAMGVAFKGMNRMSSGVLTSLLPVVAILAVAGKLAQIFFKGTMETRKEMGLTFTEAAGLQKVLNTTALEFKLMGVSAEDVKAGAQGIMDNMGGVSQVTKENITAFAQMNATLGISGENAGLLAVNMMAVGVSSMEAVNSQLQSVAALAQASGVAPASIMNDVAQNADKFAEFARDGGENVFKAAIGARQLGVNMSTVAGAADALLDFESSINDQMEASMLTGKMINTDKARELALSGDLAGMQREIVSQVGSQAEFDRMNVIQRQAMAKAFGVSVQDLAKMVANQEKLNNMTEGQKERQDMVASVIQGLNSLFARAVASLEPLIPIALAILSPFILLAAAVGGILVGFGSIVTFILEIEYLGKALLIAVSAMSTFKLVNALMNMQIGKSKKLTLGKLLIDKKAYMIEKARTMGQKAQLAQEYIAQSLTKKGMVLRLREIGTMALKNTQRLLGMAVTRGGHPLTLKTLKLRGMEIASMLKQMIVEKAQAVGRVGLAIATGALSIASKIGAGAMTLFNAALYANPIGLIVLGVVALIAGIVLLVKKFGLMKVVGSVLKVAFFPLFGIIGTFKLIGSAIGGLKGVFEFFGKAVKAYLNIAFAPFFLAYKIFQKAKSFIGSFFGGGEEGETEGEQKVTPESNAGKGGKVRQTVTETTIRNGQVVESKSQTKEITMRLDKLNNTSQENVDASQQGASQTRRLNSSIASS